MVPVRLFPLVAVLLAALAVGSAGAAAPAGPTGLHGFTLLADEPAPTGNVFSQTPSFSWNPISGATGYEFQLSTNATFGGSNGADNAIFYDTNSLTSPVVAPPLVLPWISGSPHSIYARVRATTASGVTAWSADYGFDVSPDPLVPTPLSTYGAPGLLRWTPVEGADAYEIWLVDLPNGGKVVRTRTNVLDEREFYSFHSSAQWISSVRWRVRALRSTEAGTPGNHFPAVTYTQWSPIYKATNPAFATGQLTLGATISDVREDGTASHTQLAHQLMPAFTWSGNQITLPNATTAAAELFRVEVFSDRTCVNRVYSSPIVGGQSWAPRPNGSMTLPAPGALGSARASYPSDGAQGVSFTYDGSPITSAEDAAPASPTTAPPADAVPSGASQPVAAPADPATIAPVAGTAPAPGAPVDLWDTHWPDTGYYWTVVPVAAATTAHGSTVVTPGASQGSNVVPVADSSVFATGEIVSIGVAPNSDTGTVTGVGNGLLTLAGTLTAGHVAGDPVTILGGSGGSYKDLALAQDMCAAGLVHQFGLQTEPAVSRARSPFVTGLSTDGRIVSGDDADTVYGKALVAWTPALRANKYQIEWSPSDSPFVASGTLLTNGTSAVLPLTTGAWYYRVRGFDYNLPTGAQQMSWSATAKLAIAKPTFKITTPKKNTFTIAGSKSTKKAAASLTRTVQGVGFNFKVPTTWRATKTTDGVSAVGTTHGVNVTTVKLLNKDYAAAAASYAQFARKNGARPIVKSVTLTIGNAKTVAAIVADENGKRTTELNYFIKGDSATYVLAFESPPAKAAANVALFGKIAATIKLG